MKSVSTLRVGGNNPGIGRAFVALLLVWLMAINVAMAADREFDLLIPGGAAGVAIKNLSRQTGHSVIFQSVEVEGIRTNAIAGRYTLQRALEVLLQGTNLSGGLTEGGVITISQLASKDEGKDMNKAKKTTLATRLSAIFASVFTAASSTAIAVEDSGKNVFLEEVVVTAQRRAESIQDVPITISAFTEEQLRLVGIDSTLDLQLKVPGLHLEPLAGNGIAYLRGVGTDTLSPGLEPTTAVHIDGVYLPRLLSIIGDFYDAERVEVIKGPQGTLFGRNATGGAIQFISRKPEQELGGYIDVGVGNEGTIRTEGAFNTPLGEEAALRISALYHDNDGYATNKFNGDDEDTTDVESVRAHLVFNPSDAVNVRLSGDYTDDNSSRGTASHVSNPITDNPNVAFFGGTVLPDIRDTFRDVSANNETRSWGVSAEIVWDLGNYEFKSLTSYRENDNRAQVDFDLTEINTGGFNDPITESESFQQEFQLASSSDGALTWVVGAFYFTDQSLHDQIFYLSFDSFVNPTPAGIYDTVFSNDISDLDTTAWAVFGQASYRFNDNWRLNFGLRYSDEEKEIDYQGYLLQPIVPNLTGEQLLANRQSPTGAPIATLKDETDSDELTPKLGIDYFVSEDIMLFLSVTRGFKSGGYNTNLFGAVPEAIDPETIWAYEAGIKSTWMEGQVRFNAAAFYYDYEDIHQNVDLANNAQGFANVRNAGDAEVLGFEADIVVALGDNWLLDANLSLLDTEIKDLMAADLNNPQNTDIDQSGNPLPRASEVSYGAGIQYTVPMQSGSLSIRGDVYYTDDKRFWSVFSDPLNAGDAYTRVNARIQYAADDGRWLVAAYGRNLLDEDAESNGFRSTVFGNLRTYQPPMTYGINFRYNF